jgi:integrase
MARYTTNDPETGLSARKALYGASEQEARAKLIDALSAQHGGSLPFTRGRGLTLDQWIKIWITNTRVRPKTIRGYEQLLAHALPTLGRLALTALEPRHVSGLMARKRDGGLSPRSCNHLRAVLRNCLQDAMREGRVSRNVAELAKPLPLDRVAEANPLGPDQVRVLRELADSDPDGPLWLIALATGCRQSELVGLLWSDVDLVECQISILRTLQRVNGRWLVQAPKTTRSRRVIPLPQVACEALRRQRVAYTELRLKAGARWAAEFGELVFVGATGGPMDGTAITKRLQRKLIAGGLPRIRFHDLRHSAASLMLAQGVPARVVMETLGHSQIATTLNIYSHVSTDLQREAADAMDRALARS